MFSGILTLFAINTVTSEEVIIAMKKLIRASKGSNIFTSSGYISDSFALIIRYGNYEMFTLMNDVVMSSKEVCFKTLLTDIEYLKSAVQYQRGDSCNDLKTADDYKRIMHRLYIKCQGRDLMDEYLDSLYWGDD